jgi:MFS family permease
MWRDVVAASAASLCMGLGEQLWRRFLPKYLQALGAPIEAIGLFGTAEDFLDGVYQYPGGWLADRMGRRHALTLFIVLAAIGYVVYATAQQWIVVLAGLLFVSAWVSMASPALFAVIGDVLPSAHRTAGFTLLSYVKRVPLAIAPTLGGVAIARLGVVRGVRLGLGVSVLMAVAAIVVVARIRIPVLPDAEPVSVHGVWKTFAGALRRLLASDVLVRACDALVDVFLVLYAMNVVGIGAPAFGALVTVQAVTAMAAQLPAARLADRVGRKPFVIATFLAFALFPVAVVLSRGFAGLTVAFVIGGLRELGEPARKALILEFARPALRARTIGLYYLLRSLAIAPSAFVGGLLWRANPAHPFWLAATLGLAGTLLFALTVREHEAG